MIWKWISWKSLGAMVVVSDEGVVERFEISQVAPSCVSRTFIVTFSIMSGSVAKEVSLAFECHTCRNPPGKSSSSPTSLG